MGTLNKVSLGSLVKKKTQVTPSTEQGRITSAGRVVVCSNSSTAKSSTTAGGLTLVGNYSSSESSDEA